MLLDGAFGRPRQGRDHADADLDQAKVNFEKVGDGFSITRIDLVTEGDVPGIDEATFIEHAENAKKGCPISRALGAVEITLTAKLVQA